MRLAKDVFDIEFIDGGELMKLDVSRNSYGVYITKSNTNKDNDDTETRIFIPRPISKDLAEWILGDCNKNKEEEEQKNGE